MSSTINADELADISKLDRLFTDKNQRKILNSNRLKNINITDSAVLKPNETVTINTEILKINGIVIRKNHAPSVWINNKRHIGRKKISDDLSMTGISSRNKHLIVRLKKDRKSIHLKTGQFWSDNDKKIHEGFELQNVTKKNIPEHKTDVLDASDTSVADPTPI